MGSVLGGVLSLTNLYIGLKSRLGIRRGHHRLHPLLLHLDRRSTSSGLVKTQMTILENNCMQSTASSAGYSTGGTLISAFAAYMLLNPDHPLVDPADVGVGVLLGGARRDDGHSDEAADDQYRATSLSQRHRRRRNASRAAFARRQGHAIGQGAGHRRRVWPPSTSSGPSGLAISRQPAGWTAFRSNSIVERFNAKTAFGKEWIGRTVLFGWDPIFIAAGAMTGLRVSVSMMLGGTLCWAVFVPLIQHYGVTTQPAIRTSWNGPSGAALPAWSLPACSPSPCNGGAWSGPSRNLGQTFLRAKHAAVSRYSRNGRHRDADFVVRRRATRFAGRPGLCWRNRTFGMPYWQSAVAVPFAFVLALVACRVTGETDTTPVGAMGQVTQFTFGGISPRQRLNITLMSANITAAAAGSSADLLTDLKSGYLLGANPAQTVHCPVRRHFRGNAGDGPLLSDHGAQRFRARRQEFPAPAAQTWMAVAKVVSKGLASLEPVKVWCIGIGALVGVLLAAIERDLSQV